MPKGSPVSDTDGVFNAVVVKGDFVGDLLLEGRGAGAHPTASAVVSDIVDIARGNARPAFGVPAALLKKYVAAPKMAHEGGFYVALQLLDKPGAVAAIARILADEKISIEQIVQRGKIGMDAPRATAPFILITHDTLEQAMRRALAADRERWPRRRPSAHDPDREAVTARAFLNVERSLTGRRWQARLEDQRLAEAISQQHELPDILGRVLAARGVGVDDADGFLNPTLRTLMPQPSALRDMEKGAERLADAIMNGERIGVISDYDVDGVSSAAILQLFLRAVGSDCIVHIPDRLTEGYGPSAAAVSQLKEQGAQILLTLDCGVMAHDPLAHAAELGFVTIIVDHHQAGEIAARGPCGDQSQPPGRYFGLWLSVRGGRGDDPDCRHQPRAARAGLVYRRTPRPQHAAMAGTGGAGDRLRCRAAEGPQPRLCHARPEDHGAAAKIWDSPPSPMSRD